MLSFYQGFKAFSTDAREIYSKTRYFGVSKKNPKKLEQMLLFFPDGKRFPKNVYYKTAAKSVRFCYPAYKCEPNALLSRKTSRTAAKGQSVRPDGQKGGGPDRTPGAQEIHRISSNPFHHYRHARPRSFARTHARTQRRRRSRSRNRNRFPGSGVFLNRELTTPNLRYI